MTCPARFRVSLALFLALLMACAGFAGAEESEPLPLMQFHQVGLGSANCHLLIAGQTVILLDGGTDTDAKRPASIMLDYVAATGIDHIDAHFVTHYHNDHAQQLDDFSRDYGTESTVVYGPSAQLPDRFLPLPNGTYRQLRIGDEVDVGPFHILCVAPETVDAGGEINHDSLNLVITYGGIRIMYTGDYVGGHVRKLFPEEIRDIDILVFPHHGLRPFVIGAQTLRLVNPDLVLVPGNTAALVRKYFAENDMKPEVRSPSSGHVVVTSDGVTWELHEFAALGEFAYAP